MFQNTGIPDVFAAQHNRLNKYIASGDFPYIPFEEYIRIAKESPKKFAPGTSGKAHYNDLHFEMLGIIICQVEKSTLQEAYKKYVFDSLELQSTYLYEKESDYCNNYYSKSKSIHSPNLFLSIPACGGCMSTSRELMKFLKAFFGRELFDKKVFEELTDYAGIQYAPGFGQYSGGFVRLNISGIASMFRLKGEMVGHMGGCGAYAYYYPQMDIYVVGDVNQFSKQGLLFTLPLKVAKLASKYMNPTFN